MRFLSLEQRDTVAGLAVAAVALGALGFFGAEGAARWPWVGFLWLAAVPFALLLIPQVQAWMRRAVAARPNVAVQAATALAVYGVSVGLATGTSLWYNLLAWPLCIGLAVAAAGHDGDGEPSGGRILLSALGLWVLAGIWDPTLRIRTPGDLHRSLAFFAALDLGLFLFLVVRPLRTLDVRVGLTAGEVLTALGAVAVLAAVALPTGFAIGFLRFESRWIGPGYGAVRLLGLILFVGLPEEVLFRGLLQEGLSRIWTPRAGLLMASAIFGLTHIVKYYPPLNWRYALVASLAGLAYGRVYQRTGKLAAAAVTHGATDWIWSTYLGS